jgi:hypothetical protein
MTVVALGKSLSQKDPALKPGVNDIDDCWVVAGIQASRAVGANIKGVDIPKFRKAAGRPDNPNASNPGGSADVLRGAHTLFPKLRIKVSSTNFDTFWAGLKQGAVAVALVNSGKLPVAHQYGFKGYHAITVRLAVSSTAEKLYEINPLQPKGTSAKQLTKADLKAAMLAYPRATQAVMFNPAPAVAPPVTPPVTPPTTPPTEPPVVTPPIVDPTPYSQDDLDDAHEAGRLAGVQSVIDAAEELI